MKRAHILFLPLVIQIDEAFVSIVPATKQSQTVGGIKGGGILKAMIAAMVVARCWVEPMWHKSACFAGRAKGNNDRPDLHIHNGRALIHARRVHCRLFNLEMSFNPFQS